MLPLLALLACKSEPPPEKPARIPAAEIRPEEEPYARPLHSTAVGLLRFVSADEKAVVVELVLPPQSVQGVERAEQLEPMSVRRVYHTGTWTLSVGGKAMPLKALDEGFRFEQWCKQGEVPLFRPVSRLSIGAKALPWPAAQPGDWVGFVMASPPEGPALQLPDLDGAEALLSASVDLDEAPELVLRSSQCGVALEGLGGSWELGCCVAAGTP